ncbi:hypothetical protein Btru_037583 [Bulinus truncatus]|nr:hypothetical protein Btru_037583 [Bulinus truncatus]
MNHYPDNFGYGRGSPAIPGINYGGGGAYADPSAMARMNQPRENYQMSHYPMMQQQAGMYGQTGFMGQQNNLYSNMGNYGNYRLPGVGQSPMMMGSRQSDMNRMGSSNNMMNSYYNPDPHLSPQMGSMNTQASNYSHTQPNSHIAHHHMSMMSSQNPSQTTMATQNSAPAPAASQTVHTQNVQPSTGSSHHMNQMQTHKKTGTFGNPNSPHMLPCAHHVPQHPMRHQTTQQNPQEVADNILQMASAYPSNQTVQVPLKSRPAPYHIPRSPHYSVQHSDLTHTSPNPQQQQSPVSCQTSPSPSSSSVKSPAPVLAPIPNPIPSPGISGLRSPCSQGMSPCGTQRSPSHMGSTYSGHGQSCPSSQCSNETSPYHLGMSPSDIQHYSPCAMTPTQNYSAYSASPSQRNTPMYSPSHDHNMMPNTEQLRQSGFNSSNSSNSSANNSSLFTNASKQASSGYSASAPLPPHLSNNPLMSLQKLVMLPETQVVDPKSVVNDACLSSHDEGPKNGDGPAERLAEGLSHSVGFQGTSSSPNSFSGNHASHSYYSGSQEEKHAEDNKVINQSTQLSDVSVLPFSDNKMQSDLSDDTPENSETVSEHSEHNGKQNFIDKEFTQLSAQNDNVTANILTGIQIPQDDSTNSEQLPQAQTAKEEIAQVKQLAQENILTKAEIKINGHNFTPNPIITFLTEESKKFNVEDMSDRSIISPEKKNGKVIEDVKRLLVQCRPPGVLSEVPIISNGLNGNACEKESELEQDCDMAIKHHHGLNSLVKAKLAGTKRNSQFSRVTPCSIAVGADERAACESFAYRRNGVCRVLRTTRMMHNGRNRHDSTGNADSDESSENVSEGNFISDSPQDGSKKKSNASKKPETKKSNINSLSAANKVNGGDSKSSEAVTSGSNGCVSYTQNDGSDDDVYYEGVDSSDIFINNCSSDESITSAADKMSTPPAPCKADETQNQKNLSCSNVEPKEEKCDIDQKERNTTDKKKNLNLTLDSPPSKRLRRSSGQIAQEKLKALSVTKRLSSSSISDASHTPDKTNVSQQNNFKSSKIKHEVNDFDQSEDPLKENAKVDSPKPSLSSLKSSIKYPIVVLEKSSVIASSSPVIKKEQPDIVDLTKDDMDVKTVSSEVSQAVQYYQSKDQIKVEHENQQNSNNKSAPSNAARKKKAKKRQFRINKFKKEKATFKGNRNDEVKDSFKSMKFSRTLDLLKSQRKRESSSSGPFIRVTGKLNAAPEKVTVFCQPVPDTALLANTNNKQSKNKKPNVTHSATTVHMVTNLPIDKVAMVPSNRTISQNPWECAFCGHHSSYRFLGDLFCPYFKESELTRVENIASEESRKSDNTKDHKMPDLIASGKKNMVESHSEKVASRRRKSALLTKPCEQDLPPEEIWVHEACAMWSPGVCLIGNKMYGLEEAVKDAADAICSVCKSKGAMIGCLHKGCSMKFHFICAIDKDCYLDEENLSILCPKHKDKKLNSVGNWKS